MTDLFIKDLAQAAAVNSAFKNAQFAVVKRRIGARYIFVTPGMETGWIVDAPMLHQHFDTEAEAVAYAKEKGFPNAVYPSVDGHGCVFGQMLVHTPSLGGYGVERMTVEEFNAQYDDYIPSPEELAAIDAYVRREWEMHDVAVTEKARRVKGADDPILQHPINATATSDPLDDAFIETIDPLAPNGPGSGPNTGPDPARD